MSRNSNPSINSPASSNHELDTLIRDDAQFTANLLHKFNNHQTRHISISSTALSIQYISSSPTPSVQEIPTPPPLQVCIATNGVRHYPPISPNSAETILHMEDHDLTNIACAIAHGLISTIC